MKTTIKTTVMGTVILEYSRKGRWVHREFWSPIHGGYVRQIDANHPGYLGRQVCKGLRLEGTTLSCGEGQSLETVIRREWGKD